jgi:hypothetical protein
MMVYKNMRTGELCQFFDQSTLTTCMKTSTGDAVNLASGEMIHIHPNKKVDRVTQHLGGRLATVKDRPCFVFPLSPGRMIAGYYVIIARETVDESLVQYVKIEANTGEMSNEVYIMLQALNVTLRKILKLLGGQADTLESVLEGDIIGPKKNMSPSTDRYAEFAAV